MSCSWRLLLARWRWIECKSSNWPFPPCLAGGALCSLFVCSDTGAATLVGGGRLSSKHNTTSWILSVLGDQKGFINACSRVISCEASYAAMSHSDRRTLQTTVLVLGDQIFGLKWPKLVNWSKVVKKWPKSGPE